MTTKRELHKQIQIQEEQMASLLDRFTTMTGLMAVFIEEQKKKEAELIERAKKPYKFKPSKRVNDPDAKLIIKLLGQTITK